MLSTFFSDKIRVVELVNKATSTISGFYSILELFESIESIRGVVAYRNKWTPKEVDEMEYQSDDLRGLFWWYNEIQREIANSNKQSK